ncbi:MAG: hypothetical protein A2W25_16885 [candidate division Zixibacteria bacterium RBG_16_53_22]|nr:MAG: hypothetical protein A2W25_16885 [candidate division Zixibacteria bacterium RBG_16_53_22]
MGDYSKLTAIGKAAFSVVAPPSAKWPRQGLARVAAVAEGLSGGGGVSALMFYPAPVRPAIGPGSTRPVGRAGGYADLTNPKTWPGGLGSTL